MRVLFRLSWVVLLGLLPAQRVCAAEQIFVSGGCALRYFEHSKKASHDKYWGNFIDAALARYPQIKSEIRPGDQLTWLVYRPSYMQRGKEEKTDLLAIIQSKADSIHARLLWFDTKESLIRYLNEGQNRREIKISRFEYFGHSNMRCFMFDYSNLLDGAGPDYGLLHENDLKKIHRDIFSPDAYSRSWGCHSGEEYSAVWLRGFGIPMVGAIGKTDYSNGGLPILSTAEGKWSQ